MKENVIKHKSFLFAVRIVKLYRQLCDQKKEYVLPKQLLRSGTSVSAMIREAEHAETRNDFRHKPGIAQKEINERILIEIRKIVTSILKSVKNNHSPSH